MNSCRRCGEREREASGVKGWLMRKVSFRLWGAAAKPGIEERGQWNVVEAGELEQQKLAAYTAVWDNFLQVLTLLRCCTAWNWVRLAAHLQFVHDKRLLLVDQALLLYPIPPEGKLIPSSSTSLQSRYEPVLLISIACSLASNSSWCVIPLHNATPRASRVRTLETSLKSIPIRDCLLQRIKKCT